MLYDISSVALKLPGPFLSEQYTLITVIPALVRHLSLIPYLDYKIYILYRDFHVKRHSRYIFRLI